MAVGEKPKARAAEQSVRALSRAGLLGPAYRAFERWQTWRSGRLRPGGETGPDGLPLPPQRLVVLVAGPTKVETFLRKGQIGADQVRETLSRAGVELASLRALLDWGVGCGRVARHWKDLDGPAIHGCDLNAELVLWTAEHLPFVEARHTGIRPPLPYRDGCFDLVYGYSVLTHLPEDLQTAWAAELGRLVSPGGHLLVSTHGEAYFDRLTTEERVRVTEGDIVVRFPEVAGTNLCTAFHSRASLQRQFSACFELVEHRPQGARSNGRQDLVLFRRGV